MMLYAMCMKRTNLLVDEAALDKAKQMLGLKTYSEVVNIALKEIIRTKTFEQIDEYGSSGIWEGDLKIMREDHVSACI